MIKDQIGSVLIAAASVIPGSVCISLACADKRVKVLAESDRSSIWSPRQGRGLHLQPVYERHLDLPFLPSELSFSQKYIFQRILKSGGLLVDFSAVRSLVDLSTSRWFEFDGC